MQSCYVYFLHVTSGSSRFKKIRLLAQYLDSVTTRSKMLKTVSPYCFPNEPTPSNITLNKFFYAPTSSSNPFSAKVSAVRVAGSFALGVVDTLQRSLQRLLARANFLLSQPSPLCTATTHHSLTTSTQTSCTPSKQRFLNIQNTDAHLKKTKEACPTHPTTSIHLFTDTAVGRKDGWCFYTGPGTEDYPSHGITLSKPP